MEYEERLDIEDTPDTDRLDKKLMVSGVARKLGDCEGDRDSVVDDTSRSVLMAFVVTLTGAKVVGIVLEMQLPGRFRRWSSECFAGTGASRDVETSGLTGSHRVKGRLV